MPALAGLNILLPTGSRLARSVRWPQWKADDDDLMALAGVRAGSGRAPDVRHAVRQLPPQSALTLNEASRRARDSHDCGSGGAYWNAALGVPISRSVSMRPAALDKRRAAMFVRQSRPARSPAKQAGISPGPVRSPVPAFGRPGFLSSQHLPPDVPVAPTGAGPCCAGDPLRSRAGPGIRDTSRNSRLDGAGERRRALRFKPLLAAALAVPVLVLLSTTVEAACGVRDRVSHRDSECLQAWWDNKDDKYDLTTYHVRNMCPDFGRVVAKVDLREARDRTPHLDNGQWRIGYTDSRIDWIYCCSDLSTLCNRSDLDRRDGRA